MAGKIQRSALLSCQTLSSLSDSEANPKLVPEARLLVAGTIVNSSIELRELIGVGATSSVYKGWHTILQRQVAVKIMHEELLSDSVKTERFFREAKLLSGIRHANLVTVLAYGRADGIGHFIVMEFVEGQTLADLLATRVILDTERIVKLAIGLCEAMEHVHAAGLIHRDLKPGNIMVTNYGACEQVKIIDFGLARADDEPNRDASLTSSGGVMGSPAYMSPEQCRGGKIDWKSDIYSLGCVLYEMICGSPPFVAQTSMAVMELHSRVRIDTIPALRPVPTGLELLVLRCLEKDPALRFASMREMRDELRDIEPANVARRQFPSFAVVGGSVALIAIVALACCWTLLRSKSSSESPPTTQGHVEFKLRSPSDLAAKSPSGLVDYYETWLRKVGTGKHSRAKPVDLMNAMRRLGDANFALKRFDEADKAWRDAWSVSAQHAKQLAETGRIDDEFFSCLDLILDMGNSLDNHVGAFDQVEPLFKFVDPDKTNSFPLGAAYQKLATNSAYRGDNSTAEFYFRKAVKAYGTEHRGDHIGAVNYLVENLVVQKRKMEAQALAKSELKFALNRNAAFREKLTIVNSLSIAGCDREALALVGQIEGLARGDDERGDFYSSLACALARCDRTEESIRVMTEKALKAGRPGSGKFDHLVGELCNIVIRGKSNFSPGKMFKQMIVDPAYNSNMSRRDLLRTSIRIARLLYAYQLVDRGNEVVDSIGVLIPKMEVEQLVQEYSGLNELTTSLLARKELRRAVGIYQLLEQRFRAGANTQYVSKSRLGIVHCYLRVDNFREAERELNRIQNIDERAFADDAVTMNIQRAIVLRGENHASESFPYLDRAAKIAEASGEPEVYRSNIALQMAASLRAAGRAPEAIRCLQNRLAVLPADSALRLDLLSALIDYRCEQNQWEKAYDASKEFVFIAGKMPPRRRLLSPDKLKTFKSVANQVGKGAEFEKLLSASTQNRGR